MVYDEFPEMNGHRRTPTTAEIKQERALALVIYLDLLLIVPYAIVGVVAGSLPMVAEVMRGALLLTVIMVSLRALRQSHRGLILNYDYGIGKLERALSVVVAALLLLAAGFIFWKALVGKPEAARSPIVAALAVAFVTLNLGVNSAPLLPLWRSLRTEPSVIVLSHFRARLAKALGSVVVVGSVAIQMFTSDPLAARLAEGIGSVVVGSFMVVVALTMFRESLPDLMDQSIAEPMQLQITRTLAAFFNEYDQLIQVRTRHAGNIAYVEITLGFAPERNLRELTEILDKMKSHLRDSIPNCDIVIVPRAVA